MWLWITSPTHSLHPAYMKLVFFFIKDNTLSKYFIIFLNMETVVEVILGYLNVNNKTFMLITSIVYCLSNRKLLLNTFIFNTLLNRLFRGHLLSESLLRWSSVDGRPCLSSPRSDWEILSLCGEPLYSCRHKEDKDRQIFTLEHKGTIWIWAAVKRWPNVQGVCSRHACVPQSAI